MVINMNKRRPILILLALAVLLCLSGCVNVGTTMTVDENFSGQREITLSFAAELMQTDGVLNDMDNHIADAKPADMDFYRTDSADPIEYVFTVRFDSLDEYKDKIENITGREVSVEFSYVDQPYNRDIRLVEDFDSSELFVWFEEVLESQREAIETAMGTPVDFSDMWTLSGYTLELAGENFTSTNSKISYSHGGGDLISGIEMTTVIHVDEQYTRYIEFEFSSRSSEVDQTDVIERLSESLPEGASLEQTVNDEGTSAIISFTAVNTQQLAELTTTALDGKRATSSWGDVDDPSQPLTTLNGFEETFDLSSFSSDDELDFTYRIISEAGLPSELSDSLSGDSADMEIEASGSTLAYTGSGTDFGFRTIIASVSQAESINYGLVVESEKSLIREIRITLPENSEAQVASQIEAYYANRGASNTEIITSASAEKPYVLITIKGTAAQICAAEDILFGVSADRRLSYIREGGLFKVKPDATLVDSYDISALLSLTGVSEYIYIVHTGDRVYQCSIAAGDALPTDSPIAVRCSDASQRMSFVGTYVNSDAIIFICLLVVLMLLLAALAVTMFLSHRADKEQKNEEPTALTEGDEVKALPRTESQDFLAVREEPEHIVPTAPVELERYRDSQPPVQPEPQPEPETQSDDMLGIFVGADLGEEAYKPQEPKEDPILIEAIPVEEPEPQPEPEPEPQPEPQPEPETDPEPDRFEGYVDRFPMENLPPVVQSPENSTDKYSDSDFISDLRYLGYLDEYTKRKAARVRVKVKKKNRGKEEKTDK